MKNRMTLIVIGVLAIAPTYRAVADDANSGLNPGSDSSANGGLLANSAANTTGANSMDADTSTKAKVESGVNSKPTGTPQTHAKLHKTKTRVGVNSRLDEHLDRHTHTHDVDDTAANPDAKVGTGASVNSDGGPANVNVAPGVSVR